MGKEEKNIYVSVEEQEAKRASLLRVLDITITLLVIAICSFIFTYFQEEELQKYFLLIIFSCIGLYYARYLFKTKKTKHPEPIKRKKGTVSAVVMLNEHGAFMKEWNLERQVSLLIGKNTKNKEVDIDLSDSVYDALIHDEHALMNFAAGSWYLEGIHSPSSVSVKKANDVTRYRLVDNKPCKIDCGDLIYIANTRLLIK